MAQRPTAGVELLLHVGTENAGLNGRESGGLIDREHLVQSPQVHGNNAPLLRRIRLEASGDAAAAAKGNEHQIMLDGCPHEAGDFVFGAGVDHDVRDAVEIVAQSLQELHYRFTGPVDHAQFVVGADVIRSVERAE